MDAQAAHTCLLTGTHVVTPQPSTVFTPLASQQLHEVGGTSILVHEKK